ncbi:hypothetical protein M409DRAFT_69255 [Zasmidium cellare ATCC 36951]|uniref:Sulfite efflux pump SSU1 n=1 Tax=Zasmidium cellare ATCC 36951 TaxID=1080233 RepID=A0A6A6C9Q0_ZASCE|nr:uncharacterized protein M409DRAFT_69255 [Zasmidium cellare ATCC 36951]KAF2162379.1 hypothetical protein M409DRAFT_69255 [Zasmidium cellare ATCC 36951]
MDNNNPAMTSPATQRLRSSTSRPDQTDPSGQDAQPSTQNAPKSKNDTGWRRIIRNFSPSWFSVTMGTGIVSTIFITIPWKADWLYYLSIIFFVLNVVLFFSALGVSILRYTLWPEIWGVMIRDPVNSLFLGTVPMGFATIVEMWVFVCVPAWGPWAAYFAFALWVLDAIVAVSVTLSLGILLMSASHQRSLDTITAAQLLPIAATIVAAGTGAETASILPQHTPQLALGTLIASYAMWGMGVPYALSVLVIYYQRLALHKLPPREVIVSCFLPLGPLGFGGYTILYLGKVANQVFPLTHSIDPLAGRIAYVMGFFVALVMWGYGLVWFALALASIFKARPKWNNMGIWGFTFPLGVYSVSTILIGEELPSLFFRVLGTIFATAVVLLWVFIFACTAQGAWSGKLFHAPCLANLKREDLVQDAVEEEKRVESASESERER